MDETLTRNMNLRVILHHFHNRVYHEYVTSLREKHQYVQNKMSNTCPAKVGEIMLIKQDVPESGGKKEKSSN